MLKPAALDRRIDLYKYDYGVLLIMMSSAVRLLVAGGFVEVFLWAFVARNEEQSWKKNECFCIALALSRVEMTFKGRSATHNDKILVRPFYTSNKKNF